MYDWQYSFSLFCGCSCQVLGGTVCSTKVFKFWWSPTFYFVVCGSKLPVIWYGCIVSVDQLEEYCHFNKIKSSNLWTWDYFQHSNVFQYFYHYKQCCINTHLPEYMYSFQRFLRNWQITKFQTQDLKNKHPLPDRHCQTALQHSCLDIHSPPPWVSLCFSTFHSQAVVVVV